MAGAAARLEVVTGRAAGMSLVIDDELIIGRLADGAGKLADDEEISRSHARLSTDPRGVCAIEDLGSTNGTFVNGMRITAPQTLTEGDTIELGATTLVVRELPGRRDEPAVATPGTPPQRTVAAAVPAPAAVEAAEAAEAAGQPDASAAEGPAADASAGLPTEALPAADAPSPPAEPIEPQELPEAEPTCGPEPEVPPTLSLQLDIDFETRELRLRLDDRSEPLRLLYDGDSWRPASPAIEKGNPA